MIACRIVDASTHYVVRAHGWLLLMSLACLLKFPACWCCLLDAAVACFLLLSLVCCCCRLLAAAVSRLLSFTDCASIWHYLLPFWWPTWDSWPFWQYIWLIVGWHPDRAGKHQWWPHSIMVTISSSNSIRNIMPRATWQDDCWFMLQQEASNKVIDIMRRDMEV